jgi:putative serine protease PepD
VSFDDDADDDPPQYGPVPHPDDRLWRHPSEVGAGCRMPGARSFTPAPRLGGRGGGTRPRPWVVVGACLGAAGAVAVGLGVGVAGVGDTAAPPPSVTSPPVRVPQAAAPSLDAATLAGARDAIAPSVVALDTGTAVAGPPAAAPPEAGSPPDADAPPATGEAGGVGATGGSGVIVRPEGIVVTSSTLAATPALDVRLTDGRTVTATLLGSDQLTGLAVLDLAGDGYPYAELGPGPSDPAAMAASRAGGDPLAPGEPAVTVAAPPSPTAPIADDTPRPRRSDLRATLTSASTPAASAGQAGAAERIVRSDGAVLEGVVAVDGTIAPTTLGGPVVTGDGTLAGVTAVVGDETLAYATPVDIVRKVVDDVLVDGRAHHAWLGVEGIDTSPEEAGRTDPAFGVLGEDAGVVLTAVSPDGPGAAAGLRAEDVVLAIGGRPVERMPEFVRWLRSWSPGETAELTIQRDGVESTIRVALAELPS